MNKSFILALFVLFFNPQIFAQDSFEERIAEIKSEYDITNQGQGNEIYGVKKLNYKCEDQTGDMVCYYGNYGLRLITGDFYADGSETNFEIYLTNGDLLFIFHKTTVFNLSDYNTVKNKEITEKRFYFADDKAIKCLYKDNVYDQFSDASNQEVDCTDIAFAFYKKVLAVVDLPAKSQVECILLED